MVKKSYDQELCYLPGPEGRGGTHVTHVTEECPGGKDMGPRPLREPMPKRSILMIFVNSNALFFE
jgi:hypothetical protein